MMVETKVEEGRLTVAHAVEAMESERKASFMVQAEVTIA